MGLSKNPKFNLKKLQISTDKKALQVSKKELEPGQNIMIAHMTTQVERRMNE